MRQRLSVFVFLLLVASLLAACGTSATPTPVSQATTAAPAGQTQGSAPTTAPTAKPTVAEVLSTVRPTLPPQASGASGAKLTTQPDLPAIPADAKKGGTLTIANPSTMPIDLHPAPVTTSFTAGWGIIYYLIWEGGLLSYNFNSLEWQLAMAKDVKVDETGKIFTFTLRPNLKWSDGSVMTAEDFQFAFENISKPNKENPALNYAGLIDKVQVASMKADNATTLTVTMQRVFARDLAFQFLNLGPISKKAWEGKPFYDVANNPEMKKPSVSHGPYMLDSYDPSTQGVFKPNPNWYLGKSNFEQVIVKPFAPNVVSEAMKTAQADITGFNLPTSFYDDLKKSENLTTYDWYGVQNNYRYIVYNTTAAPFKDKALRQAVALALDRKNMMLLAEGGKAIPQFTFETESSPFYTNEVKKWDFDLASAKKLLADNGYKLDGNNLMGKDGKPLTFTMIYTPSDVTAKAVCTYIQQQLKLVGIESTVETKDPQAYLSAILSKKYDAAIGFTGAATFPDPDSRKTFYTKDGTYNVAGHVVPRLDEIFAQGAVELDAEKRKKLYQEAMVILTEDLPSQVFYTQIFYVPATKKLGGIALTKGGSIYGNHAIATWYFKQ
jgi:peptide/nickel transport system substrate-binding protein